MNTYDYNENAWKTDAESDMNTPQTKKAPNILSS